MEHTNKYHLKQAEKSINEALEHLSKVKPMSLKNDLHRDHLLVAKGKITDSIEYVQLIK